MALILNRVRSLLSKMFSLCEKWGLRPDGSNPCRHVQRYHEREVHRPLSELEIARLARVLTEAEGDDPTTSENPRVIAAIRLLMFTGCRRNEVLRLRWGAVDLERRVLWLGETKNGPKVVPLNSASVDVLEAQTRLLGNPFVFPSPVKPGAPLADVKGVWSRIRQRARLSDVRLHDLRHNFAATAAAGGQSLHQISQLLGRQQPRTTARYSDMLQDPKRQASEQVADLMTRAILKDA